VPTDAEWTILTDYLTNNGYGYEGSGSDIAKSMAATSDWSASATAGHVGNDQTSNNSSGFTTLPGGLRFSAGSFGYVGLTGYLWTSTEDSSPNAWLRSITYANANVNRWNTDKKNGFSVRCIKD
jgi:uncharacterized protein (TIGR02145 family)